MADLLKQHRTTGRDIRIASGGYVNVTVESNPGNISGRIRLAYYDLNREGERIAPHFIDLDPREAWKLLADLVGVLKPR